jgi:hypothetical protein
LLGFLVPPVSKLYVEESCGKHALLSACRDDVHAVNSKRFSGNMIHTKMVMERFVLSSPVCVDLILRRYCEFSSLFVMIRSHDGIDCALVLVYSNMLVELKLLFEFQI